MNEHSPTPTHASTLYLRLAEFAAKPVVEQARLRAQLEAVVAAGLAVLPERDRLVLEAPDGLVIAVLGNAVGALEAAERCLDAAAVLPLCIGAGHGAIAPVEGNGAVQGMIGDSVQSAGAAAGFAKPGGMLATRAFREAVTQQAPVRKTDLRRAGTFADASVRSHELFRMDRAGRAQRRTWLVGIGAFTVTLLVGAGVIGRMANRQLGPFAPLAHLSFAIAPQGEVFVDGTSRGTSPPLAALDLRGGAHTLDVRHGDDPPLHLDLTLKPGEQRAITHAFTPLPYLTFDVSPAGDVLVDGQAQGSAPALKRLDVAEGDHTVEVRRAGYASKKWTVHVNRGQMVAIKHVFAPGIVVLDVAPGGEVFVNGERRGALPELHSLELAPGTYAIEVRYAKFPPLQKSVQVVEGQQVTISYEFKTSAQKKQPKTLFEKWFGHKR